MKPRTSRHLVVASLPGRCPVCGEDRVMRLVRLDGIRGAGRVACPHCQNRVPVLHLPFRTDTPGGAA